MKRFDEIFKDPISGLTHLASALAALVGALVLGWLGPAGIPARASLLIYGASSVILFTASSIYHLVKTSPARELWLRKLDHTSIFLFIAGTYTPVCVIVMTGAWGWGLLIAVWSLAALGILFKFAFMRAPRWLSVGIYLAMGWLGVIAIAQLTQALPFAAFVWLFVGGLLYTAGALVYATKRLNFFPGIFGFHEVWHLFVTAASAAHYVFIVAYVLPFALR